MRLLSRLLQLPILLIAVAFAVPVHARTAATSSPAARLPLAFEANRGQVDPAVHFLARGPGYTLTLTDAEARFHLEPGSQGPVASVALRLDGARAPGRIAGESPQSGVSNYFDLSRGTAIATGVPRFDRVRLSGVYRGVDIVYYGSAGELEYDFVVAAGADPAQIGLRFDGVDQLAVGGDGALEIAVAGRRLAFHPPVAYQWRGGERVVIDSRYVLSGDRVGFELGAYDPGIALTIDPVFVYATYLGGSDEDRAFKVAVNAAGEAYVTGYTCSTNFPLVSALDSSYGGSCDAYLTKFSADGSAVLFSTYLGGPGYQEGNGIALDPAGNIYVTGRNSANGTDDAFELKLNPSASALLYTHTLVASGYDFGYGITADAAGNAYVIGTTASPDFPITPGALTPTYAGGDKGFFRKIGPTGTVLMSTYLGTVANNIQGFGIALDSGGNVLLTGRSYAVDPDGDIFVSKLNSAGTALVFGRRIGGSGYDAAYAVRGDSAGNIYLAGGSNSTDLVLTGGFDTTITGNYAGLLMKLDGSGNILASTAYEATDFEEFNDLALAPDGSVMAAGRSGAFSLSSMAIHASASLGSLLAVAAYGGSSGAIGNGIAVDGNGDAYVVSDGAGTLPTTAGAYQTSPAANQNGHLGKINWSAQPSLAIGDRVRFENAGSVDFPITIGAVSAAPITLTYSTTNGTAVGGPDFVTASNATQVVPAGTTSATLNVALTNDASDENDETFSITVSASGATVTDGSAVGTIRDDDNPPTLSISDCFITEGGVCSFDVNVLVPSGKVITVAYASGNDSATAPGDYAATSGTLTIPAGTAVAHITVPTVNDALYEGGEGFFMTLSAPVNATLATATGYGTITDNDPVPTFAVDNGGCSVTEGDSGQSNCNFVVRVSPAAGMDLRVNTVTEDATAADGTDYLGHTLTLRTIPAGQSTITVAVPVLGDLTVEPDENFRLTVTGATGLSGTVVATGTIRTDDVTPTLSADTGGCTVTEGDSGSLNCAVVLRLSKAIDQPVSFVTQTFDGTATAGTDYTGHGVTNRLIPAGQTTLTVNVPVIGDGVDEPNENFILRVGSVANATPFGFDATGTIVDNDPTPVLSVDNGGCSSSENSGGCVFTFRLDRPSASAVSFTTATANGTATAGSDYTAQGATARSIPAGQTSLTVFVAYLDDSTDEPDETFTLSATGISNATPGSLGATGTIVDNDAAPLLTVDNGGCTVTEGNSGSTACNFVFHLLPASGKTVSFSSATADGTAVAGSDYTAHTATLRTIPAGQTTLTVTVPVLGDTLFESNETFALTVSAVSNATPSSPSYTGTITDDDVAPTVSVDNGGCSVTEGDSGSRDCVFTLRLSAVSGRTASVLTSTTGGSAVDGVDYTGHSLVVRSIPAGQTTTAVAVPVLGDLLVEGNETFGLTVSNAGNTSTITFTATGTIVDDDLPGPGTLRMLTATQDVGEANGSASIEVMRVGGTGGAASATVTTRPGSATAGADYGTVSATVQWANGEGGSKFVAVPIVADSVTEANESFSVDLGNVQGAGLGSPSTTTVTILDAQSFLFCDGFESGLACQ